MIQIELLLAHRYWQSDKHTVRFSVAAPELRAPTHSMRLSSTAGIKERIKP
jgi:hypothetical protein